MPTYRDEKVRFQAFLDPDKAAQLDRLIIACGFKRPGKPNRPAVGRFLEWVAGMEAEELKGLGNDDR